MPTISRKARQHKPKNAIIITVSYPRAFAVLFHTATDFLIGYRFLFVGLFLFASVFFFSFPYLYANVLMPTPVKKNSLRKQQIMVQNSLLGTIAPKDPPIRIVIPSLSIDLPVVEAQVVNGYWETSDTAASHGVGSAVPGGSGNMVIFAHARQGLFLPLRNIADGAAIYVMTKDTWFTYKVVATKLVYPDETEVIAPTKDQTLTLYTCDGYFDEKRFIAVAKRKSP